MFKKATIPLLLLCAAMLFSSCTVNGSSASPETESDIRLTVEDVFAPYTDAQNKRFSERLTEIYRRANLLAYGAEPDEDQLQAIREDLSTRRLPALELRRVSATELGKLCTKMEQALTAWESADSTDPRRVTEIMSTFYSDALQLLGSSRAGALAYDSTVFWLDNRIAWCESRYQETGDDSFLAEAALFRAQRTNVAEQLGTSAFSKICSAVLFGGSVLSRLFSGEENMTMTALTSGEWILLLQMQAEQINAEHISAEQWQAALGLLRIIEEKTELFDKTLSPLQARELDALLTPAYSDALGAVLPQLAQQYQMLTHRLSTRDIRALQTGNETERTALICKLLLQDKEELSQLAESLAVSLSSAADAEKDLLIAEGIWEDYLGFAASLPTVSPERLLSSIETFLNQPDEQSLCVLKKEVQGYFHTFAPYATYVFFNTQEEPT